MFEARRVAYSTDKEGITEQLKREKPMEWVGRMNEVRMRVERMVVEEMLIER